MSPQQVSSAPGLVSEAAKSIPANEGLIKKPLKALLKHHSPNALKSAFIRHWAVSNGVALEKVMRGEAACEILSIGDNAPDTGLDAQIDRICPTLSLKELEGVFEELMSAEQRKSLGAVYTPNYIIDYLVNNALTSRRSSGAIPRICDPCCGSGGFLIRAADILVKDHGFSASHAFSKALVGFDKDPLAVEHSRCVAELYLALRGVSLPFQDLKIFCVDSLVFTSEHLKTLSGSHHGFEAVISNPPYVKLQNLDHGYREVMSVRFPEYTHGSYSLALLFLVAGHQLLAAGGSLAYITQNNLFTSLAGEQVRQYLQQERCIRRIVDFGHHHVFDNASAYTCLIFLGQEPSDTFEYDVVPEKAASVSLDKADFSLIRHDALSAKKWRLFKPNHADRIKQIELIGTPLGSMTSIRVGFATLKDSVFLVQQKDTCCIAAAPDHSVHEIETELTRPAVKVADLASQSDLASNTRRVIFPYIRSNGRCEILSEDNLRRKYPNGHCYLLQCRDLLAERDKGKQDYRAWYAWGRTQGMESPGPKLLTKTFNKRPRFMLDTSDQLFCNGYAISMNRQDTLLAEMPLLGLQRVLNSVVMHYYAKMTSFQLEGDYQCYQKNFIAGFGVPDLNSAQYDRLLSLEDQDVDEYVATLYGLQLDELTAVLCQS